MTPNPPPTPTAPADAGDRRDAMAEIAAKPTVTLKIVIALTESEARALDALVGYGDDAFVKAFYERLGEGYMKDHEGGLRSLFKSVREFMPGLLSRTNAARKSFND
jgi:hypothetical protein